jgi:hypothetical protein
VVYFLQNVISFQLLLLLLLLLLLVGVVSPSRHDT